MVTRRAGARSGTKEAVIRDALQSDDGETFATAAAAATNRGIDTTDRLLERAGAGDRYAIFELFRLIDEARIDRALAVLRGRLDLDGLGSGPAMDLGLGEAFLDQFSRAGSAAIEIVGQGRKRRGIIHDGSSPSWPGLSRPSTSSSASNVLRRGYQAQGRA